MVARSSQARMPAVEEVSFIVRKERYECRLTMLKAEGASMSLHNLLSKRQLAVEMARGFAPFLLYSHFAGGFRAWYYQVAMWPF